MDNSYVDLEIKPHYNTNCKTMEYSNNKQYRECLRKAFYMTCDLEHLMEENPDYDDETLDEELYENEKTKLALDYVFNKTKDNSVFQKMYLHTAAKLICENIDLGMTVLFSYDFFSIFHKCLIKFFNDGVLYEDDEDVQTILNN